MSCPLKNCMSKISIGDKSCFCEYIQEEVRTIPEKDFRRLME